MRTETHVLTRQALEDLEGPLILIGAGLSDERRSLGKCEEKLIDVKNMVIYFSGGDSLNRPV